VLDELPQTVCVACGNREELTLFIRQLSSFTLGE
jgi:hypothetical protein